MTTKTWEDRKKEARKLITQKSEAATYKPESTLNTSGYEVKLDGYIVHFMENKGRITYLGEHDPEGNYK